MKQLIRFVINGFFATFVHYTVFFVSIEIFKFNYIALANLLGAFFGISCSFVGNKWFVFQNSKVNITWQFSKFLMTYVSLGGFTSIIMFVWSDLSEMNYNYGFCLVTFLQFILSYSMNRNWIFK